MTPKGLDLPGGCKSTDEFARYLISKIRECVTEYKNKEETVKHLWEKFKIDPEDTRICWDYYEKQYPDIISSYTGYCENLRKIREKIETEKKKKTSEEVTAPTQATQADSSKPVEDSTKVTEPGQSTDQKAKEMSSNVANFPFGCKSTEELIDFVKTRIEERIVADKSKEETEKHLLDHFQIRPEVTRAIWDQLEKENPSLFSWYHTELGRRLGVMHSKDPKAKEQQQQQRLFPPARHRLTETAPNASSQQAAIAPNRVEQISSEENARKKQKTQHLQASQQPVSSATESVVILEQIVTTVTKIATTSEQMLKLMTDAAKSREKQQQVEQEQVRGDNEETENLQNQK